MDRNKIADLLAFDSLSVAERATGESYKDDESTMALGFMLHLDNGARKDAALLATDDTTFSCTVERQLEVYASLGFREVLCDEFRGHGKAETFRILWHPDGILGTCESYGSTGRNTAKIYYNWLPGDGVDRWNYTSSGSFFADTWVGDHDVREGLRHKFTGLRDNGLFLREWAKRPFLWLLTYADDDVPGYDHKAITEGRISRLPAEVQAAIRGAS